MNIRGIQMTFESFMTNIIIGIVSGGFSSLIISRIFLITTTFKEQLQRVQTRVEALYKISGMLMACCIYNHIDDNILSHIREVANAEFDEYNKMIFDDLEDELHTIAVAMSDYVDEVSRIKTYKDFDVKYYREKIEILFNKFNAYKYSFNGVLMESILRDKIVIGTFLIFVIVIILTIVVHCFKI